MTTPRALYLRMAIGVLALLGLLVAIYLSLYELNLSGSLVCPNTGCETVNQSEYVYMLGLPIGVIGVIGYAAILAVTLGWMTRRFLGPVPVRVLLLGLSAGGFGFSLFLTYLEVFVIQALCTWCLVSAVLMTALFALAVAAWPAEGRPA